MDVEQEGGINKNALHFAAWKGDLETILLLLDAGKSYGLNDLVNRFSTGKGNYGKTLIFYAITQCRDDVVLLLLSRGADLLIVNNKGQTPRSIATSHLGADTCRVLFDAEISQLQEAVAGSRGGFVNHRETHSDGERYCDLDPRFTIDETNMSDEITADLKAYNQLLQEDEGDDRICPPSAGGLETLLRTSENVRLPRVLQPTSRYVKRTKSDDPSCRDDVVLLLLSRGADLLIVNNKGQTPRSIATSHLGADTCRVLFDAEISQLQEAVAGSRGGFVNHRETHSDGERYCDLDPRFTIDETNMSDEITADLKAYNQLLQEDEGDDRICPPSAGGLETLLRTSENVRLPRVLQPTSRYVKRTKSDDPSSAPINGVPETINAKRSSPKKTLKAPRERKEIDISHLENLTFENLSPPDCDHTKSRTMLLVDDIESISKLLEMVERSVACVELSNNTTGVGGELISDSIFVQCPWGLDCEWKPSRTKGSENPVSTLQLSTADDAFLVDLQTICQTEIKSSKIEMTEVEVLLSDCLTKLFSNPNIAILGFAVSQDIGKLAASFPHLPCFHLFQSVVDVHAVLLHFFPNIPKQEISSLQKVVAALLGKFLDKSQQCSDWSQRPLESAQIKYAMLDSAVLPTLLQLIMARNRASRSFSDDHFQKTPHLRSTFRFTHLDEVTFCAGDVNIPTAYLVEMGSVKKSLNLRMAKQLWPTGALAPGPPVQAPHGTATSQKTCKEIKEKSKVSSSKKRNRRARRSKTKMLTEIHGNFTTLPDPGSIVGYTKDSCVHSVLGDDFISSLPDDTILGFNRRGGVLEIANGWMLFVNFGQRAGSSNYSDYRNNFLNNGKQLTFSINRGRDIQASLLQFLMPEKSSTITNAASENSGKVVLFLRPSTREKFIFCGECTCDGLSETRGHIVDLVLNLLDFDALVNSDDGTASPYRQVVSSHEGMIADNEENRPETEEWEASFLMSHP